MSNLEKDMKKVKKDIEDFEALFVEHKEATENDLIFLATRLAACRVLLADSVDLLTDFSDNGVIVGSNYTRTNVLISKIEEFDNE